MLITSKDNPKIKHLISLNKKNHRDLEKLFIIEGEREITRAIKCGLKIHSLFESEQNATFLPIKTIGYQLSAKLFQKISYRQNPTGHIAIFHKPDTNINNLQSTKKSFILVIESPEKPGNVGALLRTADAVGIESIIITNPNLDLFNANVIRSAAGTFFSKPIYLSENENTIKLLKKNKINIICTTPQANQYYHQIKYQRPLAIVAGAEDKGLSEQWLSAATTTIKIPMHGIADSLNLSVATAIVLYEALRQNQ